MRTRSDDGIRLWMDDELVIDDWSWHPPREHRYDFEVTVERQRIEIRVEHFEIDGFAVLEVEFVERQPHGRSQQ